MTPARKTRPKSNGKAKKWEKRQLKISRKPSDDLRHYLRGAATKLLKEGFDYREALDLMRLYLLSQAHVISGGEHKKAGQILGISRDHARDYYERGAEIVR